MDEKQQLITVIDKLKEVEANLYHQLEKAEHTAGILRSRKDDDRRKMNSSDTYGFVSALMGALFGFALWGGIATGNPGTIGLASGGLATSLGAVGLNLHVRKTCKKDMRNINMATSEVWKYYRALESQLDFVQLKIKSLEKMLATEKIDVQEIEKIRTAKYEGKKSISMDENVKADVNKLGASYSEVDEVNLIV